MLRYFNNVPEMERTAQTNREPVSLKQLPELPADMVVYVNAATSSEKTSRRVKKIRKDCREVTVPDPRSMCSADPLYVAFTSTNDFATGIVMPMANFVFPDLITDKLHLISAANSPWLRTHEKPTPLTGECSPADICFKIAEGDYYLPRIPGRAQASGIKPGIDPFWIFNVDSNLVNGHGDVWNPNVENMMAVILSKNGQFRL